MGIIVFFLCQLFFCLHLYRFYSLPIFFPEDFLASRPPGIALHRPAPRRGGGLRGRARRRSKGLGRSTLVLLFG